jgi:5-methylcytosine-specific restriction endonuclease McrA
MIPAAVSNSDQPEKRRINEQKLLELYKLWTGNKNPVATPGQKRYPTKLATAKKWALSENNPWVVTVATAPIGTYTYWATEGSEKDLLGTATKSTSAAGPRQPSSRLADTHPGRSVSMQPVDMFMPPDRRLTAERGEVAEYNSTGCAPSKCCMHAQQIPKRKASISHALKNAVWEAYIGSLRYEGACECCGKKFIRHETTTWHAAHVTAESKSGETTVENLRPACNSCNTYMGTMNLLDFKAQIYGARS